MREYDDLPYIVIERRSGGVTPFLWGALLGVGAALLFAPRSGEETQEEIRQGVRRLRTAAEDRVGEVRDTVTGTIVRARGRIQDQLDTVRDTVEERAERARQAIEAGRRAALDARHELERRVEQAKETYSAAAEAVRAPAVDRQTPTVDVIITDVIVEEAERTLRQEANLFLDKPVDVFRFRDELQRVRHRAQPPLPVIDAFN